MNLIPELIKETPPPFFFFQSWMEESLKCHNSSRTRDEGKNFKAGKGIGTRAEVPLFHLQPFPFQIFIILTGIVWWNQSQSEEPQQWQDEKCAEKKKRPQKRMVNKEQTNKDEMDQLKDKLDVLQIKNCSEKIFFLTLTGDSPPPLLVPKGRVENHWNLHIP